MTRATYPEADAISLYYADRRAKRSKVSYINHIIEGVQISNILNLSYHAARAFCLHPIFQDNLSNAHNIIDFAKIPPKSIVLATEYTILANYYLPKHMGMRSLTNLPTPENKEVLAMLIMDKIQNRKDFEKYHLGKHENSDNLQKYFKEWLDYLNISEPLYLEVVLELERLYGN